MWLYTVSLRRLVSGAVQGPAPAGAAGDVCQHVEHWGPRLIEKGLRQ